MRKVLFIRHGVREPHITPLTLEINDPLTLASSGNLNYEGHKYSHKLGKFIRRNFKTPDLIYTDNSTNRTIDSGISVARGSKSKFLFMSDKIPDNYFHSEITFTSSSVSKSQELLNFYDKDIRKIKEIIEKYKSIKLEEYSYIKVNVDNINILGLVNQEQVISSLLLYSKICKIKDPLLKKIIPVSQIQRINWIINYPEINIIKEAALSLLSGIKYFSSLYSLSVIIGHHHNLNMITQYLGKPFCVDELSEYWVPPNSGLVFTFHKDYIEVEILYLNKDNKFQIIPYLKIPDIEANNNFNLIKKRVNY